ncbi:hypothetical protein D9M70_230970 [compost metagenome]
MKQGRGRSAWHVHQHLHSVGALVGAEVDTVRLRRANHLGDLRQCRFGVSPMPSGAVASQMNSIRITSETGTVFGILAGPQVSSAMGW